MFARLRAKPRPAALAVGYAGHERAAAARAFVGFGCASHVISLSGGRAQQPYAKAVAGVLLGGMIGFL